MRTFYTAFLKTLSRRLHEGNAIERGDDVWLVCMGQLQLGRTLNQLGDLGDEELMAIGLPHGWGEDWKKWISEFLDEGVVVV